jgi:hypothetical protein
MQRTFICENCRKEKESNTRLKGNQKYCGDIVCQRARKAQWQSAKMETDATYRAQQLDCLERWRIERPLDRYQDQYRQTHPEYVAENRRQQRLRNLKRRSEVASEVIVKMDALSEIESATYIMSPLISEKIVKMDTFVVKLTVLQRHSNDLFASLP